MLQAHGCLANEFTGLANRQPAALFEELRQIGPLDKFHHQEIHVAVQAGVLGLDDVGMADLGGRLHFAAETSQRVGVVQAACVHGP